MLLQIVVHCKTMFSIRTSAAIHVYKGRCLFFWWPLWLLRTSLDLSQSSIIMICSCSWLVVFSFSCFNCFCSYHVFGFLWWKRNTHQFHENAILVLHNIPGLGCLIWPPWALRRKRWARRNCRWGFVSVCLRANVAAVIKSIDGRIHVGQGVQHYMTRFSNGLARGIRRTQGC